MSATFSADRLYRYDLTREIVAPGELANSKGVIAFIGLNPSTADETLNDPTVRRCIGFARDWGFGRLVMLNIFAFRATDPRVMKRVPDPVGPMNDHFIDKHCESADRIVLAWGGHGVHDDRCVDIFAMPFIGRAMHFGRTANGQPKHPLYLAKTTRLRRWEE